MPARELVGPICIMLLRGPARLLNPNAAGAGSNYEAVDIGRESGLGWISTPNLTHRPRPGAQAEGGGEGQEIGRSLPSGCLSCQAQAQARWERAALVFQGRCGEQSGPGSTGKCVSWRFSSCCLCQLIPVPSTHQRDRSARACLPSCLQPTRKA